MKKEKVEIIDISNDFKGIASINGKKCFIENTVVGDIVDIEILEEKQKYFTAKVIDFIKRSSFRREINEINNDKNDSNAHNCKYFGKCGGCPLYFYEKNYYYNVKQSKLIENIRNSGFDFNIEDIQVFKIGIGKRRRINLKYKDGIFGFCEENSNNIVKIDNCINLTKNLNEVLKLFKHLHFSNLDSVDIFDTNIVVSINLIFKDEPKIEEFQQLSVFKNSNYVIFYSYIDKEKYIPIIGNSENIKVNIDNFEIILPQNCFLQATEESQNVMINIIKNEIINSVSKGIKIADLYCGIGTYSFPLSNIKGSKIYAFEGDFKMVENMKKNIILQKVKNIFSQQQDLFNQPLSKNELNDFDIAIINPPRNGAENQCKNIVKSKIKKVIYVSCNPQSLARDLKLFYNNNFKLKKVFMVDQFYLSKHLESVVVLEKK